MAKAAHYQGARNLKPGPAPPRTPDGLLPGLYFVLQPSGQASWACRYRADGRSRKLTLGSYPGLDLKAARGLAREALRKVAGGDDPAGEKKASRRAPAAAHDDIARVAKTFLDRYAKPNCREASWRETERILNREIIPAWAGRRLSSITRPDVHALLGAITDRGSPVLANRSAGRDPAPVSGQRSAI